MRTVMIAKDSAGQFWVGDTVQRRLVDPAGLANLIYTLNKANRFGQPIKVEDIETYGDITVLGVPLLTAEAIAAAVLAGLPDGGGLTKADVEDAVRAALAPGLHLPPDVQP